MSQNAYSEVTTMRGWAMQILPDLSTMARHTHTHTHDSGMYSARGKADSSWLPCAQHPKACSHWMNLPVLFQSYGYHHPTFFFFFANNLLLKPCRLKIHTMD